MSAWDEAEPERPDPQSRMEVLRSRLYRGPADLAKIPPPVTLIEGWLDMDSLAWIVGQSGHGKSFVALDMAGCVSNGLEWHGCPVKRAPVLYVVLEGAPGLHQRVRVWEDYYQAEMDAAFLIPPRGFHVVPDATALGMLAREMDAGLVIIDTQHRAARGLDENSNVDMGHLINGLEEVRECSGACVAIVHHTAISGTRPRGHGSIDAAADTVIRVARDGSVVKIENGKQKDHAHGRSIVLAATEHVGGLVLAEDGAGLAVADSERKVWRALRDLVAVKGGATHTDLKQAVTGSGTPVSTFNWALKRLGERGIIARKGNTYTLADPTQGTLS